MSESATSPNRSEKEIFLDALEKNTPEERAAFLDGACGKDETLRARVEALLTDHFQTDAFMKKPAGEAERATIRVFPVEEAAGTVIGRYKLLQQIGEGGCGVVYMAEQAEPVRRRVALKVIKLGMDTKQVIARFEAERQALALMDHPNIAKVLDASVTGAGRPYFVMELVKGIPITRYCDEKNLSTATRLNLFVQVCQAIQHAHQKGIIHRDIKPSNILVADQDGVPVPKIIDFGIAKATTDRKLTDKTLFTAFEQFIGTPAYMSPEQANLSGLDIDTRSDIYSLGVLLYELLTGKTPFEAKRLVVAGLDEIRRIIREEEPARPSTRLHTLNAAEQTAVAKQRQSDPPKLTHLIRGDLDWIVMKCLEKDRARRYETASGLAADLKRHLDNEPVTARPPSAAYRLQKAFRRNKLAFAAATAVVLALLAGLSVAMVGWRQTRVGRDKAEATALRERQERVRAETAEAEMRGLVNATDMNLIQQAWEQHNVDRVGELLREVRAFPDHGFEWYYWQRQTHLALLTFGGLGPVSSLAFSPDGQRFASAGTGVKVWEPDTGHELLTLKGTSGTMWSVAFSPDGKRIAAGGENGTARVWDAASGKELINLAGHTNWITSAAFSPDGRRILTGSWDGTARIWEAASGQALVTLTTEPSVQITSVAFSPDGKRVVTGSMGKTEVWDAFTGRELLTLREQSSSVAFSPDGRRIVGGGIDLTGSVYGKMAEAARVWDAATGLELLNLKGHDGVVNSVAFSADGQRIATGSDDGTAREWDAASGQELRTLNGESPSRGRRTTRLQNDHSIHAVAYSPDGLRIITGSYDGTITEWPAGGDNPLSADAAHSKMTSPFPVALSLDGRRIVTVNSVRTARLSDASNGRELLTLKDTNDVIFAVALSPDGQRIVTGGNNGAKVWDASSGREVVTLKGDGREFYSVDFSPDGQRIVTRGADGPATFWDAFSGREVFTVQPHSRSLSPHSPAMAPWFTSVTFSRDSQRVVTVSGGSTAELWDATSGRELLSLKGHKNGINSVDFSPDSQRIVTGSADKTAKVWQAADGEELLTLAGHADFIESVAFSPDGMRIATGSKDQTARVWDAVSGKKLLTLEGHNDAVLCVAFSPDGRRILTGSADKTAKLWDAATGRELLTFKGHSAEVSWVAFSPNGQWIFTGRKGKAEKVWEAARPEQAAQR